MRGSASFPQPLCPAAAHTFLLPGQLPMRRCAETQPGSCSRIAIRGAAAWPTHDYAHCPQRLQGPRPSRRLDAANCARSERPWTS
jgi:hypothetical protein